MLATKKQLAAFHDFFSENGSTLHYKKNEYVIRPGEIPSGVFFIQDGLVKAYDITKYGEENLLLIRRPAEMFPLIWAVNGEDRHIIYQAMTPTVLLQVHREKFLDYVANNPECLPPLVDITLEMYRVHSERILNLEYRSVRERLVSFLFTMQKRFGRPAADGHGIRLEVPLRHQDIASSINATRETTSRELSALERKGLLKSEQTYLTLYDVPTLRKLLE